MKKQEQKIITNIDEFDQTVSLYQLMPSGAGRGLSHLKIIVNSILNNPENKQRKPLSILITGKQGAKTHSRSFTRALGLETIKETPAQLLNAPPNAIHEFFNPLFLTQSYIVSNLDVLYPTVLRTLYEVISKGEYSGYDYNKRVKEVVRVYNPIILTASKENKIPKYFQDNIGHIVKLEDYCKAQLELIVLQRLKYAGIDYEEEKVLNLIVAYGYEDLHNIIRLLKSSITVMLAGSRKVLTVADVKKVMAFS